MELLFDKTTTTTTTTTINLPSPHKQIFPCCSF
jgi:hypothetical protein